MQVDTTAVVIIVTSLLVGSGGLAFVLRYGTRLSRTEYDSSKALLKAEQHDKDIAASNARIATMQGTFESIRDSLGRLHLLDTLTASVTVLTARLEDNRNATSELTEDFRAYLRGLPVNPK
jgi:hypothetical protein